MLLFLYWLVYDILMQKFLSLNFIWRVASNKFRKLHFENPVDIQIVENYIENVGLRTLGVVKKVVEEFQEVF